MSNLYEHIKSKTITKGNVYHNSDGHHLLITDVCMPENTYKKYLVLNKLLHKIFKPAPTSVALNWTFTINNQAIITLTDSEEKRGIFCSSIIAVDYSEKSFKDYKEYEKYLLVEVEFPTTPLLKDKRKKKK